MKAFANSHGGGDEDGTAQSSPIYIPARNAVEGQSNSTDIRLGCLAGGRNLVEVLLMRPRLRLASSTGPVLGAGQPDMAAEGPATPFLIGDCYTGLHLPEL